MKFQRLWPINCKAKSRIKGSLVKIILCCLTAGLAGPVRAESRIDKMRSEFFKQKETVPAKTEASAQSAVPEKGLFQIQSISKAAMGDNGNAEEPGGRQVGSVDIKFKISGNKDIRIPILYVYVYDKNKKLLNRLEKIYIKVGADTKAVDANSTLFKPRKTYVLTFDNPNDLHSKYFLAVVGNKKYVSVEIKPDNVSPSDFDFGEKAQYLRQSGKN